MVPEAVFFLFLIPGILSVEDGWNVLILRVIGCSDFTGLTFAFLRRSRELALMKVGLLCLALSGGQWVAIQEGSTRDPGNGP